MSGSRCSVGDEAGRMSEQRAGTMVREMTNEARRLMMVARAMGKKSLPSRPLRPKSGVKDKMMRAVA